MSVSSNDVAPRVDALQQHMANEGLDAAVLTDEATIIYFTGYQVEFFFLSRSRTIALVVPVTGEPVVVAPASHCADIAQQTGLRTTGYTSLRHAPVEEIAAALNEMGATRIGMELGFEQRINMSVADLEWLRQCVGGALADVTPAIWALRMVKSTAELGIMEHACRIAEAAWDRCLPAVCAGNTERDLAARFTAEVALLGGRVPFLIVTSGTGNYHRSNGPPRARILAPGDFIFADLGVRYGSYYSDFNRNVVVGQPAPEQLAVQTLVKEISERAGRYLIPGVRAAEVYARVLDDCHAAGLEVRVPGRIGHGLGLDATEPPHISAEDTTVLVEGLVTTIEPMIERADALYCSEVIYVVTAGGGRRLNTGSGLGVAGQAT